MDTRTQPTGVLHIMSLRAFRKARACHGSALLRGESCPVCGQAGQAAIDTLGVLTVVVLIVGVLMVATTQVAANVEAQLLCAVDLGAEADESSCGEPAATRGAGTTDDERSVDPPDFSALQKYHVTTVDGRLYGMELGSNGGVQLDPSLEHADGNQFDPSLDSESQEEAPVCQAEIEET